MRSSNSLPSSRRQQGRRRLLIVTAVAAAALLAGASWVGYSLGGGDDDDEGLVRLGANRVGGAREINSNSRRKSGRLPVGKTSQPAQRRQAGDDAPPPVAERSISGRDDVDAVDSPPLDMGALGFEVAWEGSSSVLFASSSPSSSASVSQLPPLVHWAGSSSNTSNGWTVAMLSHAERYLDAHHHNHHNHHRQQQQTQGGEGGGGAFTDARIRLAETVERCTRVVGPLRMGSAATTGAGTTTSIVTRRRLAFSLRHPICKAAVESYRQIDQEEGSTRGPEALGGAASLPASLLADLGVNQGYCDAMQSYVWRVLVPRLPSALQEALRTQHQRQLRAARMVGRAANAAGLGEGEGAAGAEEEEELKFIVWSLSGGLGNRFQSLASTLVAAMLSGRVLLVKDWFTQLPPNVKGAKPTIYPSARTTDYVLEPLEKLFNLADDAYFGGSTGAVGGGEGDYQQQQQQRQELDGLEEFLFEVTSSSSQAGGGGTASRQQRLWRRVGGRREEGKGGAANEKGSDGTSAPSGGEQLRPPNTMLLCGLFPMLSLSEFRALRPELFSRREGALTEGAQQLQGDGASSTKGRARGIAPFREDHVKIDVSARHDKKLLRWSRFACGGDLGRGGGGDGNSSSGSGGIGGGGGGDLAKTLFFAERFVYVWTNQYYAPLFFSNPATRGRMLEWFPPSTAASADDKTARHATDADDAVADNGGRGGTTPSSSSSSSLHVYAPEGPYNVLTKLLVIPSPHVMRRVVGFLRRGDPSAGAEAEEGLLSSSSSSKRTRGERQQMQRRLVPGAFVSLQVRAFSTSVFGALSQGFDTCFKALLSSLPPSAGSARGGVGGGEGEGGPSPNRDVPPFFLASIHAPVREYFTSRYGPERTVTLAPPSHEQGTGKDYRLDLDALGDMFLLSLSEVLLVSPGSTFGSFVAAFADHNPIRVDFHRAATGVGGGGGGDTPPRGDGGAAADDGGVAGAGGGIKASLRRSNRYYARIFGVGGEEGGEPMSFAPPPRSGGGAISADATASGGLCRVTLSQQPCFGSWFRYDKLWHRRGEMARWCPLQPMPLHAHRCEV